MFYFDTEKAYYATVGKTLRYLISQQFKKTYTIRKIGTRFKSSLGYYFLPCL